MEIPKSITNSTVGITNSLDNSQPFSFLDFIKILDYTVTGDTLHNTYVEYLKEWNSIKNDKDIDDNKVIIERYRDFISEINLNYTTFEEQKFLNQLDVNDPLDLDLLIPFYSKKLIEIADYYNSKREETKFQIIKKQLVGTPTILKKELKSNIINYLESVPNGSVLYNISDFIKNIDIDVDELYETYPLYFNQTPNDKIYDNKDFGYGFDIFLKNNTELLAEIFSNNTNPLKELDNLLDNKRKMTQKYLGSDFYYLSTGSTATTFISGVAVLADNPSGNFLNSDYPTTASTDRKILISSEELGYFRPHKYTILTVDGRNIDFKFNFEKILPNTVYYFKDPIINGDTQEIITFTNDDEYNRRNFTSGKSQVLPKSKKDDTKYYGYVSKIELNSNKHLDSTVNNGYLHDVKKDIYNNIFGLFKNDGSFQKTIKTYNPPPKYYQIFNGHAFYDFLYGEGRSFNYSTIDNTTYQHTRRSGLSTFTGGFSSNKLSYQLFGGDFTENFYFDPDYLPKFQVMDGIYMMDGDAPYVDSFSSDLSGFELSGSYYYSRLVDGGLNSGTPLRRALVDSLYPSITANLTIEAIPNFTTTFLVDGAHFNSPYEDLSPTIPTIYYDDTQLENSVYTLSSSENKNLYERYKSMGKLIVRNSYTLKNSPVGEELDYLTGFLTLSTYSEVLSAVTNFDLIQDLLFIETTNTIVITKIKFENGRFITPQRQTYTLHHDKLISNRYNKNGIIYFTILDRNVNTVTLNIYSFDIKKHELVKYMGGSISTATPTFSSFEYPTISYNKQKNKFGLTFMVKNPAKDFIIYDMDFDPLTKEITNIKQIGNE